MNCSRKCVARGLTTAPTKVNLPVTIKSWTPSRHPQYIVIYHNTLGDIIMSATNDHFVKRAYYLDEYYYITEIFVLTVSSGVYKVTCEIIALGNSEEISNHYVLGIDVID